MKANKIYIFEVADAKFSVSLPVEKDVTKLLPSFMPFRAADGEEHGEMLFAFTAVNRALPDEDAVLREESNNDMGYVRIYSRRDGYRLTMQYTDAVSVMHSSAAFDHVEANIRWDDTCAAEILSSMLRIVYSQAILSHSGVSLHASAVMLGGKGFLFMGKSGTGKSTHAALWQRSFGGCELLNDDNPVLRISDGAVRVYGTPWSGKTPCYKNKNCPVAGIVRLQQAKENIFTLLEDVQAFTALLPGCSALRCDAALHDKLCNTLVAITEMVPVGGLQCLPNEDAATVCRNGFLKN